jgi:hypothetical protein
MISAIERFIAAKALEKMKVRCQTLDQCLDVGCAADHTPPAGSSDEADQF